ncbi:MAG: hypothetical protein IH604_02015 [Burkholderiales bacterium]|nr:hypothetical protein [Burkholderiales bacterium]
MKICASALALFATCAALTACAPELDWRTLTVPEGQFAVLLPGKARQETRTLTTAAGELTMTMHACSVKQGTMGVAYTEFPASVLAAEQVSVHLDAARDALVRNIRGSVRLEEDIRIEGLPGRQVYAEGEAGAHTALLKARFLVSGNRLYQIAYVGAKDDLSMADIDMFLTSFRLLR